MNKRFLALYLPVDIGVLRPIGLWCIRFTPFVGVEDGLTKEMVEHSLLRRGVILDMTGTSRIHPSEEKLAEFITEKLKTQKIKAAIGIASSLGAAWALSRFSERQITIQTTLSLREMLSPLPLSALRLSEKEVSSINEVGLFTVGDLIRIPAKQIGNRFGLNVLKRIDQALGRIEEPMRLLKGATQIAATRSFEIPLTKRESLSRCVQYLFEEITVELQSKALKSASYQLIFSSPKGVVTTKNISLHLASNALSHLISVVESTIEQLRFSDGISTIKVIALDLRPLLNTQSSVFDPKGAEHFDHEKAFGELVNVISHTIGAHAVNKACFNESYLPENAFRFIPLDSTEKTKSAEHAVTCMLRRPSTLYAPPEPIKVIAMLPDEPPSWLHWRGEALRTLRGIGPERVHSEWWSETLEEAATHRDYFRILDEKYRWLWVYRDSKTYNWFLHGIWI